MFLSSISALYFEMQLKTNNYLLVAMVPDTVDEKYLAWLHDSRISNTLFTDGESLTLQTLRDYVGNHDNTNEFLFGIYTNTKTLIGTHSFRLDPVQRIATIGVMIGDVDYWGKGVPLETRARLLDWAFSDLQCVKAKAGCYSDNSPAIFNFLHQNWEIERIQKKARVSRGKSVDLIYFYITRNTWHARRKD